MSIAQTALALWGMQGATCTLIAARENRVFRVTHSGRTTALRLHRAGYRSDAQLRSELAWTMMLGAGGLPVAAPVPSLSDDFLQQVEGVQVSMLGWLGGVPMGAMDAEHSTGCFREIGVQMARMHSLSDAWRLNAGFDRPAWDAEGLLGDAPLWGRFWENPTLTPADRDLFRAFRARAAGDLMQRSEDFGLIHADLVPDNIMLDGASVQFIDFDDGGFGYRLFDVATALFKHMSAPAYPDLKAALIEGYLSQRPLDTSALDLFMALRAMTYVGWIVPRMAEDGAQARNARFTAQARKLARAYLAD